MQQHGAGHRTVRARTWALLDHDHLDLHDQSRANRIVEDAITVLIVVNVVCLILESMPTVDARFGGVFGAIEAFSIVIFSVEYIARLWSCVEQPRYGAPLAGRLRYALKPAILIDLLAILPFYLAFAGVDDLRVLRLLRVFGRLRGCLPHHRVGSPRGRGDRSAWHRHGGPANRHHQLRFCRGICRRPRSARSRSVG